MKKLLILLFISLPIVGLSSNDKFDYLALTLMYKESRFNDRIVNYDSTAVGCLQITKSLMDHVNSRSKIKFTYQDRYDRDKSVQMLRIIMDEFNPRYDLDTAGHIWSSGPYNMSSRWKYSEKYRHDLNQTYAIIKFYARMDRLDELPKEIKAERVLKSIISELIGSEIFNVIYYKGTDRLTNSRSESLSIIFNSVEDKKKYCDLISMDSLSDASGLTQTPDSIMYSGNNLIPMVIDMILESYNKE